MQDRTAIDNRPDSSAAERLMLAFAQRTGLHSPQPPQRYLWTDAFAVCNFLGLAARTGEQRYSDLALELIEQVHHVLGRHRADDARTGWISGLSEAEGERHPTSGGLRIGKKLPERAPGEAQDERREWDQDGQYFHYLTRWMHALDQTARTMQQPHFNGWARELAIAAHRGFTIKRGGRLAMVWKMSIDLSRPLVPSMGHHDPLDGLITAVELRATASGLAEIETMPQLDAALADYAVLCADREWATADPLGLGGLLTDACRVAQLIGTDALANEKLLRDLLRAALAGLPHYVAQRELGEPAPHRLAFRELGLAIGLRAIERLRSASNTPLQSLPHELAAIDAYASVAPAIETFWLDPEHQRNATWLDHRDINEVMLATCLMPDAWICLRNAAY